MVIQVMLTMFCEYLDAFNHCRSKVSLRRNEDLKKYIGNGDLMQEANSLTHISQDSENCSSPKTVCDSEQTNL